MAGWTVTNTVLNEGLNTHEESDGVHNFMRSFFDGNLPAGDYTVEYDLTVDADSTAGVYDLTGKYLDSGNSAGYPAVGDSQLTVVYSSSSSTGSADVTDKTSSDSFSSTEPPVPAVEQEPGVIVEGNETEIVVGDVIADNNSEEQSVDNAEPQDVENQESYPKSPGFEMIVAVSGLLMSVYMAKRD
ncbi:PGF-CTERM sorting domain-containing protein [Methanococcoides seepicolus]|uniref:PGF-CTERM archaeal protein-sorting signal domain-containing protein n=1 Tax=Methanococcoides seepicolus TaxID=2828780 RepID=A0A9E5DCF7_9EURY|nr:PGF-CTERM sorting domain-containing protein [Methanococcoides seepicolus]MCM1987054.1 hypothetical protein [Methanococcoides seepicolus]